MQAIQRYGNPEASTVLIQPVDDHDLAFLEAEIAEIRRQTASEFCLLAFRVANWNEDLSPWRAPAVFGRQDFGEGAGRTLAEVLQSLPAGEKTCILGGYSLAGLFALWAACQTPVFSAVAAASPSVWFPGFVDYLKTHEIRTRKVYLSLGDREEKARNPVMATVGDRIRETHALLQASGLRTTLEWNPGNHFADADQRMARAFAWAMRE